MLQILEIYKLRKQLVAWDEGCQFVLIYSYNYVLT